MKKTFLILSVSIVALMSACDSSTDQNDNASAPVDETAQPQTNDTKASQPMADEMYTCSMHNEVTPAHVRNAKWRS